MRCKNGRYITCLDIWEDAENQTVQQNLSEEFTDKRQTSPFKHVLE